ncbi:E3 ubiquitin ligase TRAF3IP2 isoform X2 [Genypterus blacodes]|uniref:E3 ubiquitin ligase TRAF3IP2 isoform X2 n=1 Tax=Genypterus blacodes TaxID=154954 RepID=UPI003F770460
MDASKGPCPHQSFPVETDEAMMFSHLDSVWPPSCQCTQTPQRSQVRGSEPAGGPLLLHPASQWRYLDRQGPGAAGGPGGRHPAAVWPSDSLLSHRGSGPPNRPQEDPAEDQPSLEPPYPLRSDFSGSVSPRFPAACGPGPGPAPCADPEPHACWLPVCPPRHNYSPPSLPPPPPQPTAPRQRVAPPADVMQEVSVGPSLQAAGAAPLREIRKTISLPAECRNVFITYSEDTSREMIPFTKFLTDQGFNPAIDIFDSRLRAMGITRWMDRYLNDKSMLIIVVISRKYKQDVEDGCDDEHGLHTKYIHNQIQNEFIQQGCLNFRLVPVLFPGATKRDVPSWLQNTTIFRWPYDTQGLLLRLLREERYIMPRVVTDLTLTVRAL